MKSFLISFKLKDQSSYDNVSAILRSFPKWACIMENVWIICSDEKLVDIRERVCNAMDGHGAVVVLNVSGTPWGTYAISKEITDWMKENI